MKSFKSVFILIFSFFIVAGITYYYSSIYFDNRMNDFVVQKTTSAHANKDTVLVIIDDKSIEKIRFPWKRSLYADMFDFLQNTAGAKLILFDALFVSPDDNNPESDINFISRIRHFDRLISGFDVHISSSDSLSETYMPLFDSKFYDIKIKSSPKAVQMKSQAGVTNFFIPYLKNISYLGSISANLDPADGVMRIFTPVVKVQENIYPSLALVAYSRITGIKNFNLTDKYLCSDDDCRSLKIPLNYGTGNYPDTIFSYAKWYTPQGEYYTHKTYSAIDIVDSYNLVKAGKKPVVNAEEFKDKIVLVGANAQAHALQDVKSTVIMGRQSGTDCIATFLDNLLNNEYSQHTTELQNILILTAISIIIFVLILNFSLIISSLSCACLALGYFLIYFLLIANCNFIIPIVTAFLVMIIAMLFGYSYRFIVEDTQKRKIQKAMGMYISNDIMKNVVKNIDEVKLGGKRAELSILFADIRGFTSISEKLQPEEVTDILNEYFSEMEPIISKYKGVLNKFIGDAVLVIFGDPIYDKDHALNAVSCADHMLKRVKYLQEKWLMEGKPKIEIGVGINTGEAFVGNIGSQNRLEYTVIGDAVNLASRIEGYNKVYKTRFLISHATYLKVRNYVDVIKIKEVTIRGKAKKIDIYEVLRMNDEQ